MSVLKIKDADGNDKWINGFGAGTESDPFQASIPDYSVATAIREIFDTYGHTVSIEEKAKGLLKFGRNDNLQNGVRELVWEQGGIEVLPGNGSNPIDSLISTDPGDDQSVIIEGHTDDGSGKTFVVQTPVLDGTNRVVLSTPLNRATRVYNDGSIDFAGDVTVYENGGNVHAKALAGINQSLKCATALSSVDYWIITQAVFDVRKNSTTSVDFEIQVALRGKVFRTRFYGTASNGSVTIPFPQPLIVPPNSDVRVLATAYANGVSVSASLHGHLAIIQS